MIIVVGIWNLVVMKTVIGHDWLASEACWQRVDESGLEWTDLGTLAGPWSTQNKHDAPVQCGYWKAST